jgi:hypothetical protein
MDADSVIAVSCGFLRVIRTKTITGVLTRAVDVMITQNERHSLAWHKPQSALNERVPVPRAVKFGQTRIAARLPSLPHSCFMSSPESRRVGGYLSARAAASINQTSTWKCRSCRADPDTDRRLQQHLTKALKGPLDLSKVDTQSRALPVKVSSIDSAMRDLRRTEFPVSAHDDKSTAHRL